MTLPPPLPTANPYAAPLSRIEEYVPQEIVLADRGTRLLAAIVDFLIVMGIAAVLGIVLAIAVPATSTGPGGAPDDTVMMIAMAVGGLLYLALIVVNLVLLHRYGQTIAKRLFNIKIVRADGSRCSLPRLVFARWLPVSLLNAIPLLGYVFTLLDPLLIFRADQRCLHDLIADTIVVKC